MGGDSQSVGQSIKFSEEYRDFRFPLQGVQISSQERGNVVVRDAEGLAGGGDKPPKMGEDGVVASVCTCHPVEGRALEVGGKERTTTGVIGVIVLVLKEMEIAEGDQPIKFLPIASIEANLGNWFRNHDDEMQRQIRLV